MRLVGGGCCFIYFFGRVISRPIRRYRRIRLAFDAGKYEVRVLANQISRFSSPQGRTVQTFTT